MTDPIRDVMVANLLDHPSASMPGLIEFGSEVPDDVTDAYAIVDRIIADERLHVALSTPPADDVREALAQVLLDEPTNDAYVMVDAILSRFEVRPHGTVTDAGRAS